MTSFHLNGLPKTLSSNTVLLQVEDTILSPWQYLLAGYSSLAHNLSLGKVDKESVEENPTHSLLRFPFS